MFDERNYSKELEDLIEAGDKDLTDQEIKELEGNAKDLFKDYVQNVS